MSALDPKTIERLARIIVDPDGPYSRSGRELEQLLVHAGWSNPPEYDSTPRIAWLIEQLDERADTDGDLERLLCRVCDPLEYDTGAEAACGFKDAINSVLVAEGLTVAETGGRPVIAELGSGGTGPITAEPHDLDARIRRLVGDQRTAETLIKRAGEARICQRHGAYTMAVIAIGSFVEGMLLTLLTERDERCRNKQFVNEHGKWGTKPQPNLASLIDTAHACGWIQLDAKRFMHTVRNFRNYIHPGLELADNPEFDDDSVGLCWAPLQAMLNDLEHELMPQAV
ncbi:hypothetical protein ACIA5E_18100 [Nocardia asteroides]|uniref:hypothetical protein n=1 Tax=Nocardia asteroides TaxID=1824 RepID=UPI0037BA220A